MPIFAYHMVDPRFSTGLTRVTPKQFDQQLSLLIKHGFRIVTISDYFQSDDDTKLIALTFDDGYESVYEYALPILKKYDVPATVFVNPAFMGQFNTWDVNLGQRFRHMDWRQLEELYKNGWEIGSHGMTHRDLPHLSVEVRERELALSRQFIERKIGDCSPVISYPFGNVSEELAVSAQKLNYKFGLTMGMFNKNMALHFSTRRIGIYRLDSLVFFKFKAFAKWTLFFRAIQMILDKCSDATVFCKRRNWTFY